jgi:DNA-binding NtrC family response regulator
MEGSVERSVQERALSQLIGTSPAFLAALACLPAIARSHAPVLISGETGTGKELVARAIHYLSARSGHPFVAVNCGSLPDTLVESELFGHERGAFTSATTARKGLLAQADQGTILLDEIDTLPHKGQIALLRVLQEKTYRPLGSSTEYAVNLRVIAATNRTIGACLQDGYFRADFFYRISIFTIDMPPLRDRAEDILPLARHFVAKHADPERAKPVLTPQASEALVNHRWPGNVRELENAMIRAIYLADGRDIEPQDLRVGSQASEAPVPRLGPMRAMKRTTIERFEREYLARLMVEHQGNVTQAARTACKERRDLGKLLKKYRLDPDQFRARVAC